MRDAPLGGAGTSACVMWVSAYGSHFGVGVVDGGLLCTRFRKDLPHTILGLSVGPGSVLSL
jgi:hypothetical protein